MPSEKVAGTEAGFLTLPLHVSVSLSPSGSPRLSLSLSLARSLARSLFVSLFRLSLHVIATSALALTAIARFTKVPISAVVYVAVRLSFLFNSVGAMTAVAIAIAGTVCTTRGYCCGCFVSRYYRPTPCNLT